MKAFYINTGKETFIAGVKYLRDDLGCFPSALKALQYAANTDGSFWEVELIGPSKAPGIFWYAEETKFLAWYNLDNIKQDMGEYIIDEFDIFMRHNLLDLDEIKITDPAAVPLGYKDKPIDTISNLHSIIHNALAAIREHSGPAVEQGYKTTFSIHLNELIRLSAPVKSAA